MAEELYPRFSQEEMARRRGLARRLMEEEGLDALVLFGIGGTNRTGQANLYYLSGYRDFNHAYFIFPREGEPTLFVGLYNHLHNAQSLSVFPDVRHGGYGPPKAVAERLEELGLGASRIGLAENMVIQPNPISADGRLGVQLGDLGVVTREGFRSLHSFPRAFLRCG